MASFVHRIARFQFALNQFFDGETYIEGAPRARRSFINNLGVRHTPLPVQKDRATTTPVSRPTQQPNTSTNGRTSYQAHTNHRQQKQKQYSSSSFLATTILTYFWGSYGTALTYTKYHGQGCVPPFRLATPPGYQVNPIPKGKPCQIY